MWQLPAKNPYSSGESSNIAYDREISALITDRLKALAISGEAYECADKLQNSSEIAEAIGKVCREHLGRHPRDQHRYLSSNPTFLSSLTSLIRQSLTIEHNLDWNLSETPPEDHLPHSDENSLSNSDLALCQIEINSNPLFDQALMEALEALVKCTGRDWRPDELSSSDSNSDEVEWIGAGVICELYTEGASRTLLQALNVVASESGFPESLRCSYLAKENGPGGNPKVAGVFIPIEIASDPDFCKRLYSSEEVAHAKNCLTNGRHILSYTSSNCQLLSRNPDRKGKGEILIEEEPFSESVRYDLSELIGSFDTRGLSFLSPSHGSHSNGHRPVGGYRIGFFARDNFEKYASLITLIGEACYCDEREIYIAQKGTGDFAISLEIPADIAEDVRFRALLRENYDLSNTLNDIIEQDWKSYHSGRLESADEADHSWSEEGDSSQHKPSAAVYTGAVLAVKTAIVNCYCDFFPISRALAELETEFKNKVDPRKINQLLDSSNLLLASNDLQVAIDFMRKVLDYLTSRSVSLFTERAYAEKRDPVTWSTFVEQCAYQFQELVSEYLDEIK